MKRTTQIVGQKGEQAAARFLKQKGMQIIATNWRHRSLEIDIICKDKNTLVFVEVKTRKKTGLEKPYEALTLKKRSAFVKAAQNYLSANDLWSLACRLDFVCVATKDNLLELEYYPHVFELSEVMGCGHASWQPW